MSTAVTDSSLDKFVLFAMNNPFGPGSVRYRTWSPLEGFSPDWVIAFSSSAGQDKPWVLRRAADDHVLFMWTSGSYSYLRTADGGNWRAPGGGLLPVMTVSTNPPDEPVTAAFCCHPAQAADGRLSLAHASGALGPPPAGANGMIRILIGVDPQGDNAGPLEFSYMRGLEGELIEFQPRLAGNKDAPVNCPNLGVKSGLVPTIVCDPSDATRAYIVYHDVDATDPGDMNVYIVRLAFVQTQSQSGWVMSTDTVVEEAVSLQGVRGDQFCPVVTVDSKGWVHVLYYDNRPAFAGDPECEPGGWGFKYDLYYALSDNHGASFTPHNLRTNCDAEPALDLGLQGAGIPPAFGPREYNGVATYESGGVTRVWTLYTGTGSDIGDDPDHRSVIYGQQIVVALPQ